MKKIFLGCTLLLCASLWAASISEPEIIIEINGAPREEYPSISVWNKNEKQLSRLFKGKDRIYVLYSIDTVSTTDETIHAQDGTLFYHVRYGQEDSQYRRFLFDEKERFLAVADNLKTVLALNQKYHLNMDVSERDFTNNFGKQAILSNLADLENNTDYQVYQLGTVFYVFHQGKLVNTYTDEKSFNNYINELSSRNKKAKQIQEEQKKAQQETARKAQQTTPQKKVRKALVWGGTVEDQMYMPRALNATPLPPLVPSTTTAGTYLRY